MHFPSCQLLPLSLDTPVALGLDNGRVCRLQHSVGEQVKHKLKRMIQSPNSFFMDVKCPGCLQAAGTSHSYWAVPRASRR